ncbi:hypothetical protein MJG53_008472, partial [Ovis ammon polii x Ovis aries]
YMGCIEVLQSMRSLDFGMRTQVTRVLIHIIQAAIYPDSYCIYKLFENAKK